MKLSDEFLLLPQPEADLSLSAPPLTVLDLSISATRRYSSWPLYTELAADTLSRNRCFYNTIVQSLSATQPLTDIISEAPSSSPALQALSPSSPAYNSDVESLPSPIPMTAALLVLLGKLDPLTDDNSDGTLGKKVFNPKGLLRQLSIKYDEYAEATQQDSHELLRHLIDGIMMEEQDVSYPSLSPLY